MFFVFQEQEIHCLLRDGDFSDGGFRFGTGDLELSVDDCCLLGDGDRLAGYIQVLPEQRGQLALPHTADQLQEKHGEDAAFVRRPEVAADTVRRENVDLSFLELWDDAVIRWIAGDEPLLHRPVQAVMEHCVDTPDVGAAEAGILRLHPLAHRVLFGVDDVQLASHLNSLL